MAETPAILTRPAEWAHLPPSPRHSLIIEKVLLAIIDAYPPSPAHGRNAKNVREMRLRAALEALFGAERQSGMPPADDLDLLIQAYGATLASEAHHVALGEDQVGPRKSLRRQADEASPLGRRRRMRGEETAAAKRARQRIARELVATGPGEDESDLIAYLRYVVLGGHHLEEQAAFETLHDLHRLLAPWGLEMNICGKALGLETMVARNSQRRGPPPRP